MQAFSLTGNNNYKIPVYKWLPTLSPKAIIHISHGMAEHGSRYDRLAKTLSSQGIVVYAHDHRGHGSTIATTGQGFFAENDGWANVVGDLACVLEKAQADYPSLPLITLGHSMGSYLLQSYLIRYNTQLAGFILSGSNYASRPLLHAARIIAYIECIRKGPKGFSPLIHQLTFAKYSKAINPRSTEYDWLSRDGVEVNNYVKNPMCGFRCTNKMWHDLLGGLLEINSVTALQNINSNLPALVLGGQSDPVSAPDGLNRLADQLRKAGLHNVTLDLYPDGRHEMFNEINREQVTERLLQWIDKLIC